LYRDGDQDVVDQQRQTRSEKQQEDKDKDPAAQD